MAGRKSDFTLPTLDDLFSTQELRDDAKLSKIRDIPLELIDDFPDHPFKVRDDEDMIQLVESVKERGVITPATVRQKEDGRYELISGHRRKRACELAGFEALRCEVVDLDRDAATVLMVESNYQRSQILPSEKAFAYKMRLEAMNRQGQRSDLTCAPVGHKLDGAKSRDILGDEVGESREQIRRYIRLTNLVQELLDLVDEGKIKMRPAVELSYLDEDSQRAVVDEIDLNQCTPSHDQTIRMRKFFTEGKLTPEVVSAIMSEEKPNQREKIVLRGDKVRSLIPKNIPVSQTEDYVVKALEHYSRFLRQRAERDMLSHPKDTHWYPVFYVMANTGMRVGEITGLRWSDIDLKKGIIRVNHTLVYYNHRDEKGCYFSINTPKTKAGEREIPMTEGVKQAFLMEREFQSQAEISSKSRVDGYDDFIFVNRYGDVQNQGNLNKALRRMMRDCNDEILEKYGADSDPVLLPQFSCHILRHTFATRLCESGANLKFIQSILGHADVSTTMNIYVDVTDALKKKEITAFDDYMTTKLET